MKHVLSSIKDFTGVNLVEEHKESQGHQTAEGKKNKKQKTNVKQATLQMTRKLPTKTMLSGF